MEGGIMKRMSFLVVCTVFFALACFVMAGHVQAAGNTAEAKALVDKAVSYAKANGKDKTVAEISKPKGQFDKGELYVFAYDMTATVIAHPKNPKIIGKNLLEVPDPDGKFFRKDVIEQAKTKGSGWVDYKYLNPETKKIEPKTTYFVRSGDIILCAGAYK
jgi:signal transduction histidine kinase